VISRPDPSSDGARWKGDLPDGSNKFRNYVWRMQAHVLGFVPYFTAWIVLFYLYQNTLDDIESAFGERVADEVPVPRSLPAALRPVAHSRSTPRNAGVHLHGAPLDLHCVQLFYDLSGTPLCATEPLPVLLAHHASSCRCTDYLSVAPSFTVPRDGASVRIPLVHLEGVHACHP
jgi:hypothetical protein